MALDKRLGLVAFPPYGGGEAEVTHPPRDRRGEQKKPPRIPRHPAFM